MDKNKLITLGYRDEKLILSGIKKGRNQAFRALYEQNADKVFRLSLQILKDEVLAQNIVQDTFMTVFNKIHTFREDSKISTWIYRIAYNLSLNELKRVKRQQSKVKELSLSMNDENETGNTFDKIYSKQQVKLVLSAVEKMSEIKRNTFMLYYVEEKTADEIAHILEEGRGTVLKRLNRIRAELIDFVKSRNQENEAFTMGKVGRS